MVKKRLKTVTKFYLREGPTQGTNVVPQSPKETQMMMMKSMKILKFLYVKSIDLRKAFSSRNQCPNTFPVAQFLKETIKTDRRIPDFYKRIFRMISCDSPYKPMMSVITFTITLPLNRTLVLLYSSIYSGEL